MANRRKHPTAPATSPPRRVRTAKLALITLALIAFSPSPRILAADAPKVAKPATAQLAFGVRMAQRGLWNEALFRFRQAEAADPGNARIRNNLAVAFEATGDFEKALEYYKKALESAPNSRELRGNYTRFVEFYQAYKGIKSKDAKGKDDKGKAAAAPRQDLGPGEGQLPIAGTPASQPAPPIEIPDNAPPPPPL